jgi:DNA-binding CsgD family transcriptional regulator
VKRLIGLSGLAVAALAFLLQRIDYQHTVRTLSTEFYLVFVALLFTGLGVWVGQRLVAGPPRAHFERNERALATLGVSPREAEVLELLAQGHSNREIADRLFVSPHTIKTHLAKARQEEGVSGAELEKLRAEMETMKQRYASPVHRLPITFLEIFPVGLLISLISASLLRNPRLLPAAANDGRLVAT